MRTVTYLLVIALLGAGYTGMAVALQTVLLFEGGRGEVECRSRGADRTATETVTTTFEPGHVSLWIPERSS
ncbi:MAG TPA: hypothetical protein VMS74_00725 [Acidimicrobiia bacterium]|nr:hypothetical protein [Acidimicrobiia bacterium]